MKYCLGTLLLIGLYSTGGFSQNISHYCLTARDEQGSTIPHVTVTFVPTKRSGSRTKYKFKSNNDGRVDVDVIDGFYDVEVRNEGFKTVKLKNQLLPYEPRACIDVTLPKHQEI